MEHLKLQLIQDMMVIKEDQLQQFTRFLYKKSSRSGVDAEPNYLLANQLHRQIIRNWKRRKVYSLFRDNICAFDLDDMQILSVYNKKIKCLLCPTVFFSKYAWVVLFIEKRGIIIANSFKKLVSRKRKPNKIWVDQGGELYNNLFKRFLKISNIEIYSTYNERKSVVAEKIIRNYWNYQELLLGR